MEGVLLHTLYLKRGSNPSRASVSLQVYMYIGR
jgi:hypothetical protein